MNNAEIIQIQDEIEAAFIGRRFGKIFQLFHYALAIDFHPHNAVYLYADIEPKTRGVYLIRRRLKDLERASIHPSPFNLLLKKLISGAELRSVRTLERSRALRFEFLAKNESGSPHNIALVIQLGGRPANIFILDGDDLIVGAMRESVDQKIGDKYLPPLERESEAAAMRQLNGNTLSDVLDRERMANDAEIAFQNLAAAARKKIQGEIAKREKLIRNLKGDLEKQGDADVWKRHGDLILANISSVRREGDSIFVIDYFDENLPEIEIASDKGFSITEAAESFFKRYTKARNGARAIAKRLAAVNAEIESLKLHRKRLEEAIDSRDEVFLSEILPPTKKKPLQNRRTKAADEFKGARRFVSSDGFEILVGKKARDNDHLTFRVARSLDFWMHAADFPGSHVLVRNPNRKEIPNQTLLEAAQLAAFYSSGREQPKAAVNYTQKKFVNKPKRAAPGLVSLASFKTILVEPKIGIKPPV